MKMKKTINRIKNFFFRRKRKTVPTFKDDFRSIYAPLDVSQRYLNSYDEVTQITGMEVTRKTLGEIESAMLVRDPSYKEMDEMVDKLNQICQTTPRSHSLNHKASELMRRIDHERSKSRSNKSSS